MNSNEKTKANNLIRGMGIYAIGKFGSKILSFLIVPLYTYYIATEDMGMYDLLMSTIGLLSPIVTLQISDAAYKWIIVEPQNKELYIRSTLQVLLINTALAVLIILLINNYYPIPFCIYFCVVLLTSRILETIQKLLRSLHNQKLFAVTGLVYSFCFLTQNVIQICVLKKGIASLFQSTVVANIISIAVVFICEPRLRVSLCRKPDIAIIKKFYKFSIPLVPNYLNWWTINSIGRYIVAFFLGMSSNGIIAVANKFPHVLQTVLGLFTTSWQDESIKETSLDKASGNTEIFRQYYKISLTILWSLIPLTKVVVHLIMGTSYKISCDYIAFYYLGAIFQSYSSFYGVGYLRKGDTGNSFLTSIYGAIGNVVMSLCLIGVMGLHAIPIANFVGFFIMWFIREKQNGIELGIILNKREFYLFTLISIIICVISIKTSTTQNIWIFIVTTIIFTIVNHIFIEKMVRIFAHKIRKITT